MAELKTKLNNASVDAFIRKLKDERAEADCRTIIRLMQKATKAEPKMWGTSIVGFGSRHLKYASGRELDWMQIGFSPRKQNLTLYILNGFEGQNTLLKQLGKHSTGKGCLYIKKLEDVDLKVLDQIVTNSVKAMKNEKT
jgi:hypothetical protein